MLLLDEPLSALDAHTKAGVRAELHELLDGLGIPVLLVTHDFEDAAALAERVSVIVDGQLRQSGTPAELVARPADAFVASFTGANLLPGHAEPGANGSSRVTLDDGTVVTTAEHASGEVVLAVYPWDVVVGAEPPHDSAMNVVGGRIRSITELGNRVRRDDRRRDRGDHGGVARAARPAHRPGRLRVVQGDGHAGRRRPPTSASRSRRASPRAGPERSYADASACRTPETASTPSSHDAMPSATSSQPSAAMCRCGRPGNSM